MATRIPQTTTLGFAVVATLSLAAWVHQAGPGAMPAGHRHQSAIDAPAAGAGPGSRTLRPVTTVKPVACEKLPNVPGKSITTAIVTFPPDGYTPRHRHPGSVTAFVLKGAVRSQLAGGPVGIYTAGQSWFEPPGTIHLFAENASLTEPAELLAIFVADEDCGPLTIPD